MTEEGYLAEKEVLVDFRNAVVSEWRSYGGRMNYKIKAHTAVDALNLSCTKFTENDAWIDAKDRLNDYDKLVAVNEGVVNLYLNNLKMLKESKEGAK